MIGTYLLKFDSKDGMISALYDAGINYESGNAIDTENYSIFIHGVTSVDSVEMEVNELGDEAPKRVVLDGYFVGVSSLVEIGLDSFIVEDEHRISNWS